MILDYIFFTILLHTSKQAAILLSCEGPWWTHQCELRLNTRSAETSGRIPGEAETSGRITREAATSSKIPGEAATSSKIPGEASS